MIKITRLFLFATFILTVFSCNRSSAASNAEASGAVTVASEINHVFENQMPVEIEAFLLPPVIDLFQYYNDYTFPFMEDFRIWGWSRDGKVAYSTTGYDGGTTTLYFNIENFLSIESNSVSYWENFDDFNVDDNGNHLDVDGRIIDFNSIYRDFYNICNEHGIEFMQSEYRRLPIVYNNDTYNVFFDINRSYDPDYGDLDIINNYRIIVETQHGIKVVHEDEDDYSLDVFSLGYFISPFENSALLAVARRIPGGYVFNFFVGFDLDTGFLPAVENFSQSDAAVVSADFVYDNVTGDYHFYADEPGYEVIIIYTTESVENFAYIDLMFHIDNNEEFLFYIGEILFSLDDFTPDKPIVISTYIGSGIPTRAIIFWHKGREWSYYLSESGMDGSLNLTEVTLYYDEDN